MSARHRDRARRGQAAVESMLMMAFVVLLVFGLMHLTMLMATRYMVNYAAFAASRAAMVGNSPQAAAEAVMENLNWWVAYDDTTPVQVEYENRDGWAGYAVTVRVPFGLPLYERIDPGGIRVIGFAPTATQANAPGGGDNGE